MKCWNRFEKLSSEADIVFIDEFHYLKNAFKFFKAIYDSKRKVKVFASGSSSVEIHKHIKESLVGRFQKTILYPLSFSESRQIPPCLLEDYLQWGGMPGLVHQKSAGDKVALLENIVSTYLTKDIKGIIQEENIRAFNALFYLLAHSQGSLVVASNLARETGLKETTIARYLEIMAQTYVCHSISSYAKNLANELKKSRKCYLFDIGIRNALLKDFRPLKAREDQGVILESFVLLNLLRQLKPNMEVRFWRTKKRDEVDFVLLKNRIPHPVEVKSSLVYSEVPKGLQIFLRNYSTAPFGIVYNTQITKEVEAENRPVFFKKIEECVDIEFLRDVL